MIQIPLTKGYTAIVDDEDAHFAELKWCARVTTFGPVYAQRASLAEGGWIGVQLHREVMGLQHKDGKIVDHINGDGLDCRRADLRVVTKRENARNLAGATAGSKSGILGVRPYKYGWEARIKVDGKHKCLGTFSTPEEANLARLKAEMELWGVQPRRRAAFQEAGFLTKGCA